MHPWRCWQQQEAGSDLHQPQHACCSHRAHQGHGHIKLHKHSSLIPDPGSHEDDQLWLAWISREPAKSWNSYKMTNISRFLNEEGCTWVFNPPHSSYTGVWDRMIGVSRRIPDSMLSQIQPSNLTHKVLSTLMEEVSNIINAGPLTTVSMHANASPLLTPNMIIIHKVCSPRPPPRCFIDADLHRQQLRRVQHFWERWRPEHLFTLQRCSKWQKSQPNIKEGDIVLFHDTQVKRNQWPMAVVMKSFPTSDSKVRTLKLIVTRGLHGLLLNLQVFNSVFNTDICV